jgi:hypothetical protein
VKSLHFCHEIFHQWRQRSRQNVVGQCPTTNNALIAVAMSKVMATSLSRASSSSGSNQIQKKNLLAEGDLLFLFWLWLGHVGG